MKAAELSPWEPIGSGAFSILITSPDLVLGGAATCTYSRQGAVGVRFAEPCLLFTSRRARKAESHRASKDSDSMILS